MTVTDSDLREMYRRMTRIRRFEATTKELLLAGELYGAFHTSTGQEASIVGSTMALRTDDYMVGTHRSHGHPIGKGAALDGLLAELMGKETGVNQGKGGSMHLSDFSVGSLGETSIVGSGLPVAAGAALGSKMQGNDRVTLCFFGDGASNQGTFHESLNLAAIWALPAVYVCENNGYGELTAAHKTMSVEHVSERAGAYDIPGVTVDGQDVLAVYEAVGEAVARGRRGGGAGRGGAGGEGGGGGGGGAGPPGRGAEPSGDDDLPVRQPRHRHADRELPRPRRGGALAEPARPAGAVP